MQSGERGVIGFMRRHPLAAYLTWFFPVGWAIAFAYCASGRGSVGTR